MILKWGYDRLPDFVNADQGLVLVVGDLDGDGIAAVGAVPEQDIERLPGRGDGAQPVSQAHRVEGSAAAGVLARVVCRTPAVSTEFVINWKMLGIAYPTISLLVVFGITTD